LLITFNADEFLIGVGILVVLLPLLWWRKHNLSYLLFFSLFWVYLLAVVQAVFFPFAINAVSESTPFTPSINLIPFYFGSCFTYMPGLCARGILENIILTFPFGFGINFLVRVKPGNLLWLALSIGLGFECSQLAISLAFRSAFRAVDINDAILNAAGVILGYAFFRAFAWVYLQATKHYGVKPNGLFADIYEIVFQTRATEGRKNS
jgi:glycopeptide antibiotics resistance protein